MKLILTLILSSILLLGCTDSKENKFLETINNVTPANTQMSARSVAQKYQVTNTKEGHIKCFVNITDKQEAIDLVNGQHVSLATGTNTTMLIKEVRWLRIIPNDLKQQSCYIQTLYLTPVADYSPDISD